jgi:hypothetical protein
LSELDFHAGEIHVAGDDGEILDAGGDDFVLHAGFADEGVIHAAFRAGFRSNAAGGICLGIEVEKEYFLPASGESGREINRGGGLSDPSFLVGNGDDLHELVTGLEGEVMEWGEEEKSLF